MRYAIAVDLGGTNIAAGVVSQKYEIVAQAAIPTRADRPWAEIVADIAKLTQQLWENCGLVKMDCAGIGIGSPGICDGFTGDVVYSNNIRWKNVPLGSTITKLTGLSCRIGNDANCAALGEVVAGAAKGCKNVVLLTLGTGIGSGIIIDGHIYQGEHGAGAELGHSMLAMGGETCTCGRRGCSEAYASATALIRQAALAAKSHPESVLGRIELTARSVYDAMRAGDAAAAEVVKQYERYLAEVIVNAVNIFRPEVVLLGGGISGEGKPLMDRMERYVKMHCFGATESFVSHVGAAALGNRAGIVGAAALCLNEDGIYAPMKLCPAYKDYLWGGERLKTDFNRRTDLSPLAESWELSCHKDGASIIENGAFSGKPLGDYIALHPNAVGKGFDGGTFPVLIKLIDAAKPLSVQVHPDDRYAQRVEGEPGKTEMWYIVDAEPGAFLYYGFKRPVTREEAEEHIANGTLTEILNAVSVKKGDVFFIESGTVHAIGAGILIAEIQQNSNTTYRLYDYNRRRADGRLRPLHVRKALDVARLDPPRYPVGPMEPPKHFSDCTVTPLAKCEYFSAELLELKGCMQGKVGEESFESLLCLDGWGAVLYSEGSVSFQKGDSLFLPAHMGFYSLAGHARLIRTTR